MAILTKRPVLSQTQGVVGAEGENPPATRLDFYFETRELAKNKAFLGLSPTRRTA